jgi:hypothetical protein
MASIINATTSTGLVSSADNSGSLQLATNNGTTAVTIDTSQNVGIGTGSPDGKLTIETANSNTPRIRFQNASFDGDAAVSTFVSSTGTDLVLGSNTYINSSGNLARFDSAQAGSYVYAGRTGNLFFGTNDTSGVATERMRIASDGNVAIGTSTPLVGRITVAYNSNSGAGIIINQTNAGAAGNLMSFRLNNVEVGSIYQNTANTSYITSSDYRLKENIAPMTGALAKVAQLKPCTYTWKIDGSDGQGFIAHELQAVVPDAVVGEKDAVETYTDKDGNEQTRIKPQGIDTSFLVATLTAAIQELNAKVEAQAVRIAELEGAK